MENSLNLPLDFLLVIWRKTDLNLANFSFSYEAKLYLNFINFIGIFILAQYFDFLQGLMGEVFFALKVSYAILTSYRVLHMCFR